MGPSPLTKPQTAATFPLPMFWPVMAASTLFQSGLDLAAHTLKFLEEEARVGDTPKPKLATPSRPDLRTLALRDYGAPDASGLPTLVDAPYAGRPAR